jgi:hypothetical protein
MVKRLFLVVAVISVSLLGRAQCASTYMTESCSIGNCSSSTQINVPIPDPINGFYTPRMMVISCCDGETETMFYLGPPYCYTTRLQQPEVQERLAEQSQHRPVYVANCDGWVRPFHSIVNESRIALNRKIMQ